MMNSGNRVARTAAALMLALVTMGFTATGAFAQGVSIPDALVTKARLTDDDKNTLEAAVKAAKAGLMGDAEQIRVARTALLKPLSGNASLQFRLEYAAALRGTLEELVASGKEQTAINALRIAGEAGATGTLAVLLSQLDPEKTVSSPVRVAACVGVGRLFEVTAKQDPAVNPADLTKAVNALAEVAGKTNDPFVVDAAVRALATAVSIPAAKAEAGLLTSTVSKLSQIGGKRAAAIGEPGSAAYMSPVIRAAGAVRDVVISTTLNDATYREAAAFAGDVAVAIVRLRSKPIEGIETQMIEQASGAAGTIVAITGGLLDKGGARPKPPTDIAALIGADGVLSKPPFGFPADRFKP